MTSDLTPIGEITSLLASSRAGDESARELLLEQVYSHLHLVAAGLLNREHSCATLQPTALVHEAFLRIFHGAAIDFRDRNHFFRIAARQMRRMLVDAARRRAAIKNGFGLQRIALEDLGVAPASESGVQQVIEIDRLLQRLAAVDRSAAEVVELRYFAGFTAAETAEFLNVSVNTVGRDWDFARAWLRRAIGHSRPEPPV